MRKNRTKKIAKTLGNASKWHSHGRGIPMSRLVGEELKLMIDDFGADQKLKSLVRNYHGLAVDYFGKLYTYGANTWHQLGGSSSYGSCRFITASAQGFWRCVYTDILFHFVFRWLVTGICQLFFPRHRFHFSVHSGSPGFCILSRRLSSNPERLTVSAANSLSLESSSERTSQWPHCFSPIFNK